MCSHNCSDIKIYQALAMGPALAIYIDYESSASPQLIKYECYRVLFLHGSSMNHISLVMNSTR